MVANNQTMAIVLYNSRYDCVQGRHNRAFDEDSMMLKIPTLALMMTFCFCVNQTEGRQANHQETVVSDFGFKISSPDEEWTIKKTNPDTDSVMVKVSLKKAGGAIEATLIAEPSTADENEAEKKRDAAFDRIADSKKYANRSKKDFTIDNVSSQGFQLDWSIQGGNYRVQQCYVCNQMFCYTIAIHSPVDKFDEFFETLDSIRKSIQFVPISDHARKTAQLKRLAAKCGSEVDWARSWKEASQRAIEENKKILILIRSQPGFDIADGVTTIGLMDPDVIEILNAHCVVFRFEKGDKAPFTSYDKYGIGPSSFGNTVLLAEPDGTICGDTFSYEPNTFYDFLKTHLASRVGNLDPPPESTGPLQVAKWYARHGDLVSALRQLQNVDSATAHQIRASIFRRQRNAVRAISELEQASLKSNDSHLVQKLRFEKTKISLYAGQISAKEALTVFDEVLARIGDHPHGAEISCWKGLCQLAVSNKEAAEQTWTNLIEKFDESNRWTWKAAALLSSTAFQMDIKPEFNWPTDEVVQSFRSIPFEESDSAKIKDLQNEAIEYLLAGQRSDGSWISPPDALKTKGYNTSPFTIAITSICANSLLAHREEPAIAKRIEQALKFLIQSHEAAKTEPGKTFYMDYSPWADAYLLRCLAHYVRAYPAQTDRIRPIVTDVVLKLSQKQKPGGGWSYYITHNLSQANRPSNQSISFMTAAVIVALVEARDSGFDVPNKLTESAIDCLVRMRNSNSTFTYFLWHEDESGQRNAGEEGSAGRGPLCAYALAMADRGKPGEVAACLDLFMKYKNLYSRERGKSLMHAAPGGQGSHYLIFDYCWAAQAVTALPNERQEKYRQQLLELLNNSRSQAGSYLDNPINGWHYGTAMALEAFNALGSVH